MFDLDTLHGMNARAAREGQLRREEEVATRRQSPIAMLAYKLLIGNPPAIYALVSLFNNAESYQDFVKIVREFLPEREGDILSKDAVGEQVASFASYFEDRYFPLHPSLADGGTEEYEQITGQIPLQVMGMSYDDYHMMDYYRFGIQLMTYMCANPYVDDESDRVALADLCQQHVDQSLLDRVPVEGFSLEELSGFLKRTQFDGLRDWCAILHSSTDNPFLDIDDVSYSEGAWQEPWLMDSVRILKDWWFKANKIYDQAMKLAEWIEADPPAHFEELLNFVLAKREKYKKKEGLSSKQQRGCHLDNIYRLPGR